MKFTILDIKWAEVLQRDFEDYMYTLKESVDDGEDVETESGWPYCGCDTCDFREILSFFTPRLLQAEKEGKVELNAS